MLSFASKLTSSPKHILLLKTINLAVGFTGLIGVEIDLLSLPSFSSKGLTAIGCSELCSSIITVFLISLVSSVPFSATGLFKMLVVFVDFFVLFYLELHQVYLC